MLAEILYLQGQTKNFSGMHWRIVTYCLVTQKLFLENYRWESIYAILTWSQKQSSKNLTI